MSANQPVQHHPAVDLPAAVDVHFAVVLPVHEAAVEAALVCLAVFAPAQFEASAEAAVEAWPEVLAAFAVEAVLAGTAVQVGLETVLQNHPDPVAVVSL